LVEDNLYVVQRVRDGFSIGQIAFDELDVVPDPRRLAAPMRLRLEVIENPDLPAFSLQRLGHMRTNQAGTAGNQSSFSL
jgi:hypothetical protein